MTIHNHVVDKHQTFSLVEGGLCTLQEASDKLGLSYRQTLRWWRRYKDSCGSLVDFVPPKRGGGWNKITNDTITEILKLKTDKPTYSNPHIADILTEQGKSVSASSVKRILVDHDIYLASKIRWKTHKRFEANAFGERLQIDTTEGAWIQGYRRVYLIAIIDEYSRMLVGWRWVSSDSAWNNMSVISSVFAKYGLPKMLYTDNASMFKTIRHDKSIYQKHKQEGYETEIQRAVKDLGVVMFSHKPYQPQSKGKIERFFRFMQDRFIKEHTATNLDEMNEQFEKWANWYNSKHVIRTTSKKPKDRQTPSVFSPVPRSQKLDRTFCFKYTRKIDKCNSFSVDGCGYTLAEKPCLVHRTVNLESTPDKIRVYHNDKFIQEFDRINKD
ncbi:MAG: DDE-type integrase/transposase/recombinase [Candidatus Uhrbacteria bacterium]